MTDDRITADPWLSALTPRSVEDLTAWTSNFARAQALLAEFALDPQVQANGLQAASPWGDPASWLALIPPPFGMAGLANLSGAPATAPLSDGVAPPIPGVGMRPWPATGVAPETGNDTANTAAAGAATIPGLAATPWPATGKTDPFAGVEAWWKSGIEAWQAILGAMLPASAAGDAPSAANPPRDDKRFAAPDWREQPVFALIKQSYDLFAARMFAAAESTPVTDERAREQLRFATQNIVDAMAPTNFAATNPEVMRRTLETRGANLVKGLEHMLADLKRGQLTHVDADRFEVGGNIATTPGKVVHRTDLYELIHYAPITDTVLRTPLIVFPPWINRFYILDLNEKKSFVRWALDQGLSMFMVSWRSADASMRDLDWDDYVAAQIEAIATVREALDVDAVHAIGYCVAGTTLAATLALLAARGADDAVRSATFFTAQVDFEDAGDLGLLVTEPNLQLIEQLSAPGYFDGRYMAATFNALRGRDLIWNYVVSNYLLGEDYAPFDLLYWNGDTTNLPPKWHGAYLRDLYRDNKLVEAGGVTIDGTQIDLRQVKIPAYIQAGEDDHIAPATSVFRMTQLFSGPTRFVLAGSGHIAGVINPPSAQKYQYWRNDRRVDSLEEFVADATETKGSWWPDWIEWIAAFDRDEERVPATGARVPGETLPALGDAPGEYVRAR